MWKKFERPAIVGTLSFAGVKLGQMVAPAGSLWQLVAGVAGGIAGAYGGLAIKLGGASK